jgi:hypothetical protein
MISSSTRHENKWENDSFQNVEEVYAFITNCIYEAPKEVLTKIENNQKQRKFGWSYEIQSENTK